MTAPTTGEQQVAPPRQRTGLRWQLTVAFAVLALAPTVLLGALAISRARRDVQREVIRGNLALIRAIGQQLNGAVQDTRRTLLVAAAAWAGGARPTPTLLRRLSSEVALLRTIVALDPRGRPILAPASDAPSALARGLARNLDLAGTYGGYVSDVRFDARAGGAPYVLLVVQARDRRGELVGFLAAVVDLTFVARRLAEARLGPGASLLVVDGNGRRVASAGRLPSMGAKPRASLRDHHPGVDAVLASHSEGHLELVDRTGQRWVAVYRNIAGMSAFRGVRWCVVLQQPTSAAYALARKTRRDTLIVAAAVSIVALGLAAWFARRVTAPLARLVGQTERVAAGKLDVELPDDAELTIEEIAVLTRSFAAMVDKLGERARLEQQLVRSEKLSSIGVLAAGVAHEINNPLTTILGYAKLLLEGRAEDDPDRDGLELIADESRRVQHIVRELLDFSRARAVRIEPVAVGEVLQRTLTLAQANLKKHRVTVERDVPEDLPLARGDTMRIEQVFLNLVTNAAQAMKDAAGSLQVRMRADASRLRCSFTDNGEGIASEDLPRIFDPFFTTKGPGEGTGLGLAVSHRIVGDMGGEIDVASVVGEGTTFTVSLPLADAVDAADAADDDSSAADAKNTASVAADNDGPDG